MKTSYVTTISLDEDRLAKDLAQAETFRYSEAYSNYLIGGPWKNAMLWAAGGDTGSGLVTEYAYEQRPTFTDYGARLPYLQDIISAVAEPDLLQFVRLAVVSDSVIIPHRDYLELGELPEDQRPAHRLHIPLITHDNCFFSEDNTVYRMRAGEVWFFDAAQVHSVASFERKARIHLIFDFADRPDSGPLLRLANASTGDRFPAESRITRPPLPDSRRQELRRLADLLTIDNYRDVFSLVIKTHFRFDGGEDFAWDTMTALARACADPTVLPQIQELRQYFTLDRSDSKE
ncbi:aspartyl/asparaginyl beta-hydroxylase domain-containing protein [Nocardia sp. NPDC020380]|uniref:aspartyl/asparaginyl beta-hydroxylase domain-containing protein n=1 Tax=Nocardia sp. NPDC020380 TaxID=3364309 RepID=UPI0037975B59